MNHEQVMSLFRTIIQVVGGVLVTRGYVTEDQAGDLTNQLIMALGAGLTVGTTAWGIWARNNKNLVKAAVEVQKKRAEGLG